MQKKITVRLVESCEPRSKPFEIRDTYLRGLILRVQPSGYRSFVVEYGRGRRHTLGDARKLSLDRARNKALEILAAVAAGEDPAESRRRERAAGSLEAFIDHEYLPWASAHRRHGATYCSIIKRVFAGLLSKKITKITAHDVDRIRTARLNDGVKPSTINRNVTCLRGAFRLAVQAGYLAQHPLAGLKDLDVDTDSHIRYLSDDERTRLMKALQDRDQLHREARQRGNAWRRRRGLPLMPIYDARQYSDHLTPLVLLSLATGARRGELFALQWRDIDMNRRSVRLRGHTTKTNRTRHVPLNDAAMDTLRIWKTQGTSQGLVFPSADGKELDNVRKAWAGVLEGANIVDFRWHDLRHDFASHLVMRGADLNTVRELLGHGDLRSTLRYAHLAPESLRRAVDLLP